MKSPSFLTSAFYLLFVIFVSTAISILRVFSKEMRAIDRDMENAETLDY